MARASAQTGTAPAHTGTAVVIYDKPRTHEANFREGKGGKLRSVELKPGLNQVDAALWAEVRVRCVGIAEEIDRREIVEINTDGQPLTPETAVTKLDERLAILVAQNLFDEKACGEYMEAYARAKRHRIVDAFKDQIEILRQLG